MRRLSTKDDRCWKFGFTACAVREWRRPMLRTVTATRYVTPLREGGSLPAVVEADDLGTYVLKFRGAGQGPKALIAEIVAGGNARCPGLHNGKEAGGGRGEISGGGGVFIKKKKEKKTQHL